MKALKYSSTYLAKKLVIVSAAAIALMSISPAYAEGYEYGVVCIQNFSSSALTITSMDHPYTLIDWNQKSTIAPNDTGWESNCIRLLPDPKHPSIKPGGYFDASGYDAKVSFILTVDGKSAVDVFYSFDKKSDRFIFHVSAVRGSPKMLIVKPSTPTGHGYAVRTQVVIICDVGGPCS